MSFFKNLFGGKSDKNSPENEPSSNASEPKTQSLLEGIYWSFAQPAFPDLATFSEALKKYHSKIDNQSAPDLNEIFYPKQEIKIQYLFWGEDEDGDDDQFEEIVTLTTENPAGFSIAEFLFLLHNKICGNLEDDDKVFFEGITQYSEMDDPNLWDLDLGS